LLEIARRLELQPQELLMVGDYLFDVQAGRAAGARTAFIATRADLEPPPEADVVIRDLRELLHVCPRRTGERR
jgi:phosphoglycolate phosphatase-like HAD superfamily hydrolase